MGVFLRPNLNDARWQHYSTSEREEIAQSDKEMEETTRDIFGGKVAVLDSVRQLPKVTGKKIVDLLRRKGR